MQPGEVIGDYEVLGRLGTGGIGEVYKVRQRICDRIEAMKVLLTEHVGGEIDERFLREVRVVANLDHPHIATLRTALRVDERVYMIMEFVDGETLRARQRRAPVTLRDGLRYICDVLSALDYAHTRGVVHRDVKPSNIMITRQEQVKLLDFGLAFTTADVALTRSGAILGSSPYIAPEQIVGEKVDARCDVYSTGATLYELLTGHGPIEGTTEQSLLMGHLNQTPRPPSERNPAIPESISDAVLRALAKSPADRFQTAREFSTALQAAVCDEAATISTTLPPTASGVPRNTPGSPATPASGSGHGSSSVGPATLEAVSKELAAFIGPVAKVVVKRAASRCATVDELYSQIANEIPSAVDRKRFLAKKRPA